MPTSSGSSSLISWGSSARSEQSRGRNNRRSLDRGQGIPWNGRASSSRTCRRGSPLTSAQRQERSDERGIAVLSSATLLQGTCLQQSDASRQATSWTLLERSRVSALFRCRNNADSVCRPDERLPDASDGRNLAAHLLLDPDRAPQTCRRWPSIWAGCDGDVAAAGAGPRDPAAANG